MSTKDKHHDSFILPFLRGGEQEKGNEFMTEGVVGTL
jgi:hypothetical protein